MERFLPASELLCLRPSTGDLVCEIESATAQRAVGGGAAAQPSKPMIRAPAAAAQHPDAAAAAAAPFPGRGETDVAGLARFERACAASVAALSSSLALLDELDSRHKSVSAKTSALHERCKSLADEEAKAKNAVDKIQKPLAFFDSYYLLAARLGLRAEASEATDYAAALDNCLSAYRRAALEQHRTAGGGDPALQPPPPPASLAPAYPHRVSPLPSAPLAPFDPEFPHALDRIDEAITFLAGHTGYKDASPFLAKYRFLQGRALAAVHAAAQEAIERTVAAATVELRKADAGVAALGARPGAGGAVPPPPVPSAAALASLEAAEVSQLQVRFRSELGHLRRLLQLLEARGTKRAYADVIRSVHKLYLDARVVLVAGSLRGRLGRLVEDKMAQGGAHVGPVAGAGAPAAPSPAEEEAREARIVDTVRSACVAMAQAQASEHALFHALFTTAAAPVQGGGGSRHSGGGSGSAAEGGFPPSSSPSTHSMPTHVRAAADAALGVMQEDLCGVLVDVLRPVVLSTGSLDALCSVVHVLRDEVVNDLALPRGPPLAAMARVITGLTRDVQERLIFRAEGYITERIEGIALGADPVPVSVPGVPLALADGRTATCQSLTVRGDADYPAALLAFFLRHRVAVAVAGSAGGEGPPPAAPRFDVTESWPPVLRRTVGLLTRLHRLVEPPSFNGLAQDAVGACTRVLQATSRLISTNGARETGAQAAPDAYVAARLRVALDRGAEGPTAPAPGTLTRGLLSGAVRLPAIFSGSPHPRDRLPIQYSVATPAVTGAVTAALDGELFLIKSLLALREQLSAFDVGLSSMTRTLDFSSTASALSTMLAHLRASGGSVFALSRDNPFLSLMAHGLPTVAETQVDGKVELESLLRSSCESFIGRSRALLVGSLLAVVSRHPLPPYASPSPPPNAAAEPFLRDALAALEAMCSVGGFSAALAVVRRRMGLYLGSPVTASILFRPLREGVLGAVVAVRQHLYELRVEEGGGGDAVGMAPLLALRAAAESRLATILHIVEASDQLAVDPTTPAYGYDDVLLPLAAPLAAGLLAMPTTAGGGRQAAVSPVAGAGGGFSDAAGAAAAVVDGGPGGALPGAGTGLSASAVADAPAEHTDGGVAI